MQATQPTAPEEPRTTTAGQRVHGYLLDGSDEDLKRLLTISEVMAEPTRTALRRSGIQAGWKVIDCGCGPIGGLAVLAELVGPAGRVVGVDSSQPTVQRAQAAMDALGLGNVEVVAGDVNEVDATTLGAPFDLAFTRLFLLHQTDPARTLGRIAGLLRPGGWVIVQEPLRIPPRSFPHLDALDVSWQLLGKLTEGFGASADAVENLPRFAAAAGLEVVGMSGFFNVDPPDLGFGLHAGTLAAARDRATAAGLVAREQIDALVAELRAARNGSYQWVTSPFFLDLTLRKAGDRASESK